MLTDVVLSQISCREKPFTPEALLRAKLDSASCQWVSIYNPSVSKLDDAVAVGSIGL